MPIADDLRWSVAFIVSDETDKHGITERKPVGTGFFVSFRDYLSDDSSAYLTFTYFVTAAHVVRGAINPTIRVHSVDEEGGRAPGPVVDLPAGHWFHNPDRLKDTAVTLMNLPPDSHYFFGVKPPPDWRTSFPSFDEPYTRRHARPQLASPWLFRGRAALGQQALYVGLLTNVNQMGNDNIPMVRSGTIGAFYQEGVPINLSGDSVKVRAHLLDSLSYGGFSGSPVWLYREAYDITSKRVPVRNPYGPATIGGPTEIECGLTLHEQTEFLGMVIGHFDYYEKFSEDGDLAAIDCGRREFRLPLNAGVAVVIPSEYIWETLNMEDVVANREERKRKAVEE